MIGLGAALLVIVSTFFPMISGNDLAEELSSLWNSTENEMYFEIAKENQTRGIIILVLAGLMGLFSFLSNKKHLFSIGTLIMSGLLMLISLRWSSDIGDSAGTLKFGMGLILFLVGSGLGLVSSILGFMKK